MLAGLLRDRVYSTGLGIELAYFCFISEQLMSVPSIYYNINSKTSLRVSSIENNLSNELEPINLSPTKTDEMLRRISYRSNGCTCQELTCGCCIGMNIQQFQFNREGMYHTAFCRNSFVIIVNNYV